MKVNRKYPLKPILVTNKEAIKLIHDRAKRESRSLANTVAVTIKESLSCKNDNIESGRNRQYKKV